MDEITNQSILILFIGFSLYNMGYMMSSQMQHFALYPLVEPQGFTKYMRQNNKLAVIPAVVPGFICLLLSIILFFLKPASVPNWYTYLGLGMNLIVIVSTIIWQRSLHIELAETGFDAAKIQLLLNTNWIRTIAYIIQGIASL
jgi:asparagine N-glycosylation enzyme membrane subunit Stt3